MSVGKLSSRKTPLRSDNNQRDATDPESASNPKLVYSKIRSPSGFGFEAEAPAQLLLKSAIKNTKNKSETKSVHSGKSGNSNAKETGKKSPGVRVAHFSPAHQAKPDYLDHDERLHQRVGRSGAGSLENRYSRNTLDDEREYRTSARSSVKKSPAKKSPAKSPFKKHSTTSKQGSTSPYGRAREGIVSGFEHHESHEDIHNRSHKYSIEEDLEILDYVQSKPDSHFISKNFWKQAVDEDDLLNGKRSSESLRERYRHHLRYLSDEEQHRMVRWHNRHEEAGYGNYSTKPVRDDDGKIHYQKRLEGIDSGADSNLFSSVSNRKKKSASKPATLTIDTKEGILKEGESRFEDEITEDHLRASKKRRDYESMHQLDDRLLPRKDFRDDDYFYEEEDRRERRVSNKEMWLHELAERYSINPDKMTSLYYNCNMDSDLLRRYLDGETEILWNNDEDILLTGSQRESAQRVLSRYKGTSNVNSRSSFLKELDRLQARHDVHRPSYF